MPDQSDSGDWLPCALTATGITTVACITAIVLSVLADGTVGAVAGALIAAPAVPVGIWVDSRARRTARPGSPPPSEPPAPPDTGPVLAALEAANEMHRRDDERAFDVRIAAAECDAVGHLPPAAETDTIDIDICVWGSTKPIRGRPRCRRCGTPLDETPTEPQEAP